MLETSRLRRRPLSIPGCLRANSPTSPGRSSTGHLQQSSAFTVRFHGRLQRAVCDTVHFHGRLQRTVGDAVHYRRWASTDRLQPPSTSEVEVQQSAGKKKHENKKAIRWYAEQIRHSESTLPSALTIRRFPRRLHKRKHARNLAFLASNPPLDAPKGLFIVGVSKDIKERKNKTPLSTNLVRRRRFKELPLGSGQKVFFAAAWDPING